LYNLSYIMPIDYLGLVKRQIDIYTHSGLTKMDSSIMIP
jgi:hypothetical protein